MIDREIEYKLYNLYKLCELIVSKQINDIDTQNALTMALEDSIKNLNFMIFEKTKFNNYENIIEKNQKGEQDGKKKKN